MRFPKISIITPSFNQGQYIEQTICSVLNQDYPNLEYIIIDGGSTDNSVEIIKKYSDKLSYWISEPDKGQSDAINKGLKLATGDIINWLNSDDYYEPGVLFKVAEAFSDKNVLVVGGRSILFKNHHEIVRESRGTDVYLGNLPKTIGWARIDQPETFFRKEAINVLGPLDTRLHYLMDRDWWIKFLLNFGLNGIRKMPDIFVNFRLHDDSKTVSQSQEFQIEHDTYFYALAKKYNFSSIATVIAEETQVKSEFDILFNFNFNINSEERLIKQVLQYFLLLRANEFYAANKMRKTKKLLSFVDKNLLKTEDRRLWEKLNFRSKLPLGLVKLFRKKN